MLATRSRRLTADEFLAEFEGVAGKWELVGGEPRMMTGGSASHANVAGNIYHALRLQLRGTGCRPFNSDIGLRLANDEVSYPDVAIYCDPRDSGLDLLTVKAFRFPIVIFEVLSPSTSRTDRGDKVRRYQDVGSLRLIVLVDPERRTFETYERIEEGWRVGLHEPGATLKVTNPAFQITAEEMFAED